MFEAGVQAGIALYDEGRAAAAMIVYGTLEVLAFGARAAADLAEGMAQLAAQLAKGAARAAGLAARLADAAVHYAQYMASVAAQDWAIAGHYAALVAKLTAAYAKQMARKVAKAARAVGRVLKKVAKKLARAAVAVAKAAYKYSGAQDVVSCVTHPHLSSCLKAALTIALVVGTGGEGEAEVIAMDAAEQAGARAAEEAGGNAVKDAVESCVAGGMSFTAGTKVLLASGKAVPISSLKPGEKVLATSTSTGKTRAETISVVMVHHDTNLYDLTIRANARTAVIDTTSNHPFWVPGTSGAGGRWVKAGALKYGTHLRTPAGGTATVLGGHPPSDRSGWMWDLTIPGDHDFYIIAAITAEHMADGNHFSYNAAGGLTAVLVHNCDPVADFAVPKRPGVYTVHAYSGDKYVGSATWNMRERVADVLGPRHAFTRAGYTCEDICNVTWIELSRGVSSITARRIEQTVMEGGRVKASDW